MHSLTHNRQKKDLMITVRLIRKTWMLLFMLQLSVLFVHAQYGNVSYFNEGNKLFNQKKYYEASQLFEKYLQSEKKGRGRGTAFAVEKKVKGKTNVKPHEEAVFRLAECYRFVHDYTRSEKWYKEATKFSNVAYPTSQYWYGVSLRANQKYQEAFEAITKFEENYKELDSNLVNADKELANIKFIQSQASRARHDQFIIEPLIDSSHKSVYAMSVLSDDSIAFTATHANPAEVKGGKETFYNDIYISTPDAQIATNAQVVRVGGLEGEHNGLTTFSPDGKRMYFTRWTKTNGITESKIYLSKKSDSGWSQGEILDEPINMAETNSTQPFMTKDGKFLLFASNRPGGEGGYDLWVAALDSNYQVLSVRNLGNKLNGPGDEEAPYYHSQSRTLVFSTNGRTGMGGFDIFYSVGDFTLLRWEPPINPGAPINSTRDDIYFVSSDEENLWNTGWLSSDRSNDCCLALFSLRDNTEHHIVGTIIDSKTHKPLANVDLTIMHTRQSDHPLAKISTDSLGRYHFELKNISRVRIKADKSGYHPIEDLFGIHFGPGVDTVRNEALPMDPITNDSINKEVIGKLQELSKPEKQSNFDYKKATLKSATNANLDSLARLLMKYPRVNVQINGYTDGIGGVKYNLKLAQARVNTCIKYLIRKGIDPERLIGKAMGKCCPIAPEKIHGKDNPAGRAKNRRVEFQLVEGK
ncbi:MAG: PD40 domain-containing protein [Bacteroidetes bacterium]|nr:PD40 domain-containing protein [Bacteroidota bacterium]